MTTLSNIDIEKELGENILIYPFSKANLRGASYNLTVSKLAWNLKDGKSLYDSSTGILTIPPQSTALIETLEAIWVSSKISGTYHSKVGLVSKGLSHIGTTLDPEYIGSSLIAIHNHSSERVELLAERDTFVSLIFHYVNSEATIKPGNLPGRPDILNRFTLTPEENRWLDVEFRKVPDALKEELSKSPDFQEILARREAEKRKIQAVINTVKNRRKRLFTYAILIVLFVGLVAFNNYLSSNKNILSQYQWYDLVVNIVYTLMLGIPGSVLIKLISDMK